MSSDQEWRELTLGDVATLEYGAALPATTRSGDEFPVFGSNGEVGRNNAALVNGPGIIVGRKGTVGAVTWSPTDFWPIDTTYFVEALPSVDKRWLYWAMSVLGLRSLDSSTGVPGLNRNDAYDLPLLIPPVREQQRVAGVVDALDSQVSATERIVAKLQSCRNGVLQDILGSQAPNATLAGALVDTPANGIYKPAHLIGRGVLLVGQTAFTPERRVNPAVARRAIVTKSETRRFGLLSNDILVSRVFATLDGVGQPAFVTELTEDAVYESNMMRIRCDAAKAEPFFVFQTLLTASARAHIVRRANLSNQASISQSALTELPIWLPSLSQQRRVVEELRSLEATISAEQSLLAKLTAEKDGLLADLLSGQVRVPVGAAS